MKPATKRKAESRGKLGGAAVVSVVAAAALYGAPAASADDICLVCPPSTGQANALQKIAETPAADAFIKLRESPALQKLQTVFDKEGPGLPLPFTFSKG